MMLTIQFRNGNFLALGDDEIRAVETFTLKAAKLGEPIYGVRVHLTESLHAKNADASANTVTYIDITFASIEEQSGFAMRAMECIANDDDLEQMAQAATQVEAAVKQ